MWLIGCSLSPVSAAAETCLAQAVSTGWHKVGDADWNFGFDVDAATACRSSDCQGFLHVTVQYVGLTNTLYDRHLVSYHILQGKTEAYVSEYRNYSDAQASDTSILSVTVDAVTCSTQGFALRYRSPAGP